MRGSRENSAVKLPNSLKGGTGRQLALSRKRTGAGTRGTRCPCDQRPSRHAAPAEAWQLGAHPQEGPAPGSASRGRAEPPRGRVTPGIGTSTGLGAGRPALQRPVRGYCSPGPAPPAAPVLTRHSGQIGVRVAEPAGAEEAAEPGALGVPAALHGGSAPAALATTNGCRKASP